MTMTTAKPCCRRSFTLVELLVAIAIIAVLAAILVPTLYRVVYRAWESAIAMEMNQLHMAIEAYKLKFGDYPPDFSDPDKVVSHLLKLFPRHNEVMTNTGMTLPTGAPARDVDTKIPFNVEQLDPSEALVFWLSMLKNDPRQPFNGSGDTLKFFEFDEKRLVDLDEDGWLSYLPPNGKSAPYVYFQMTTYNLGFPPNQPIGNAPSFPNPPTCRWPSLPPRKQPATSVGVVYPFQTNHRVAPSGYWTNYRPNQKWANNTTFQIISAGLDGEFGEDVYGDSSKPNAHKIFPSEPVTNQLELNWTSVQDLDNIANFSAGKVFKDFLK